MKIRQLILCASAVYAQGADILREAYEGNYAFFIWLRQRVLSLQSITKFGASTINNNLTRHNIGVIQNERVKQVKPGINWAGPYFAVLALRTWFQIVLVLQALLTTHHSKPERWVQAPLTR